MKQTALMNDPVLIDETRLMAWLDYQRRGDLKRWLAENQIRYHTGRNGKIAVLADDLKGAAGNDNKEVEF